jgi:hypothetical protein
MEKEIKKECLVVKEGGGEEERGGGVGKEGDEEEDNPGALLRQAAAHQAALCVLPSIFSSQTISLLCCVEEWGLGLEEGSGDVKEQTEGRARGLKE